MRSTYKPRLGSVAGRVIEFLSSNPGEELSRSDVAAKYDCSAQSVSSLLAPAVDSGVLAYTRNDDLEMVYRYAGMPTGNPFAALAGHPQARATTTDLDPSPEALASLKIEDGVPLKLAKQSPHEKWSPLFERLVSAGQSVQVPRHWKQSLALAAAKRNRAAKEDSSLPLFRVANDHPPSPHARVWRVR